MGTWDSGPFDNDTAADWCDDLNDANPGDRPALIRAALRRAADEEDYLDSGLACEAIAAAAILAAQSPGGQPIASVYAPAFLRDDGGLDVPDDLAALAVRAIDRIMADDSEWRDLWQDATDGDTNAAFDTIRGLRTILSASQTVAEGEQDTDARIPSLQGEEHSVMGATIPWRHSADVFAQILRGHGLDPTAVTDVAAAWRAFREFLQIEIEGLSPDVDGDVDGFIIQWGRYTWHGQHLCVSFTRQLAVPSDGDCDCDCDCDDPDEQPDYWQVELTLVFDDAAGLALLENGNESDTGFYFESAGPRRVAAIAETMQYQQLQAAFDATPLYSVLSFERV